MLNLLHLYSNLGTAFLELIIILSSSIVQDREEYLHSKRELEPRIDREMWPEGQQFPESRGSSIWSAQEKTRPDIVRDPRISRFSNQSASITSSVPVGLSGAYAGRSSLESATSGPTTFGQQKHKHWPPSPPPVHAPSSTASFARQSSPGSLEHDMYASRSSFLLSQNPPEEHNQRAHALSQGAIHAQGRPTLQATPPHTSLQTQKHPSVLSKPHLKPPNHHFPQENSSSSLFRSSVHLPPEEVHLAQ
jgi:pre-mRNA cleavage complex 2 protein Pcf11/serine/threonine-protein kinase CTR1